MTSEQEEDSSNEDLNDEYEDYVEATIRDY